MGKQWVKRVLPKADAGKGGAGPSSAEKTMGDYNSEMKQEGNDLDYDKLVPPMVKAKPSAKQRKTASQRVTVTKAFYGK